MEYKVMRVPNYANDSMQVIKAQAIANRVKKLPSGVLNPKECPLCGGKMQGIEATMRVGYRKCTNCGYGQPIFQPEQVSVDSGSTLADLGKGALMALGIAALAYLIGTALE